MPRSRAEFLTTVTPRAFQSAVKQAVQLLRAGEVVALPTETVYGLAANALDARAVAKIFQIKGRPAHNPVIVHISSIQLAKQCASEWPKMAQKLARAFWPGPLSLVLPRARTIPDAVTAGGPTVGLRWPSHPFIQAVIRECGFPLAAPSANPANRVSPTTAEHVRKYFGGRIPLIVDGGPSHVGIESTVLDVSTSRPRLLRPGIIHPRALIAVTGQLRLGSGPRGGALRSPGLLRRHYAPAAKLVVWSWRSETDLRRRIESHDVTSGGPQAVPGSQRAEKLSHCHVLAHTRVPATEGFGRVSVIPRDPEAFARVLYSELHECDKARARLIVVENPPRTTEWSAVRDRLNRAAAWE